MLRVLLHIHPLLASGLTPLRVVVHKTCWSTARAQPRFGYWGESIDVVEIGVMLEHHCPELHDEIHLSSTHAILLFL